MSISINKLEWSVYEGEESVNYSLEMSAQNDTDSTVELVQSHVILFNSDGQAIASSIEDGEEFIDAGESAELSVSAGYLEGKEVVGDLENTEVHVVSRLCKASYAELPPVEIVNKPNSLQKADVSQPINVDGILSVTGLCAWLSAPDEDGESSLNARIAVNNLTDSHLYKCRVKGKIIGSNGRELSESESDEELAGNASSLIECGFWGLKPKQLTGAKLALNILLFTTLETAAAKHNGAVKSEW